jgi:hypothetical protein
MHIVRTATIHLPLTPEEALPLFTPEGERAWVPGWDPQPLHAPDGSLSRAGAVFRTAATGEETLWWVERVDPVAGAADYVRITPGNRLGTVHVRCRAAGDASCSIDVTYRLTSLSESGEAALAKLTDEAFAADLAGWQSALEQHLAAADT